MAVDGPQDSAPIFPDLRGKAALAITILFLVNVVNFVDRQLPFILIEAIKIDLKLTDAQVGLLAGLAFAVVFSTASLLLAWLADRWGPRRMLASALAAWSLLTALTGLAGSFAGLLAARMGAAAGEAGCAPPANALIARAFPPHRRALVLSLFSLGVPIGAMIGLILGGWINDVANWRTAFLIIGLPGLALALAAWIWLPEPPPAATAIASRAGTASGLRYLFGLPAFRHMVAGSALYASGSYAINVFASAFLIRVHGLTTAQAGLGFGFAFGIGGLSGTFLGGVLSDRLGKRDPKWRQLVPAIGQLLSFPTAIGAWLVPDVTVSLILLALSYAFGLLYFASSFAVAQMLAPDRVRASAAAVLYFGLTLVGASVGPMTVGWTSDLLSPHFGRLSLRYALCTIGITILWSAWHFYRASRTLSADLQRKEEPDRIHQV